MKKIRLTGHWFFYVLFCTSLALTWFYHKDATRFNDRNELWSDRAGYYIYLPAAFFYHFDARRMPADLDVQTGGGFAIDTLRNKIDTKYTYGVALLASPFFIASGLVSRVAGFHSESGFSMLYMRMMALAAVIYLMLGLWFLKKFLDCYFQPVVSLIAVSVVFLGTNLFYYSLIDGMMSHVYSFFLFALFLFALKKFLLLRSYPYFIFLSIALSLAILIRPTNILLGLLFFTWDAAGPSDWLKRARQLLKPSYILSFLAILFIVFLPQFIYWKYLSGSWLHFSYRDEGFTSWYHPRVAEVLLSPVNGLLVYSPMVMLFLTGTALMIFQRKSNGWLIAAVFALVTLICASWKMWYFGCSYGQRSFIEYYTILAVPFGYFTTWMIEKRSFVLSTGFLFLVLILTYFNLRYTSVLYRFDRCYYGSTWDWDHYLRSVERAGIISPVKQVQSVENDFENLALSPVMRPSMVFTRSGHYSVAANDKSGVTPLHSLRLADIGYPWPKTIDVQLWMLKNSGRPTGASICYAVKRGGVFLFEDRLPVDSILLNRGTWMLVKKTFIIPDVYEPDVQINLFIRNLRQADLYADDMRLKFNYSW